MTLPSLKGEGGALVALTWTRLKPVSEVTTATPPPPPPIRRPSISLGPERQEIVGEGFDRRTVVAAEVIDDDGLYVIGGEEIRARGLKGETLRYEPNRAWSPGDMAAIEPQALEILKAHDFPVHLEWPAGVWAWEGDDLFWAEAPPHAVLAGDGVEDQGMSGVERGGLGWPAVPTFGRYNDAAAQRHWPRFSPFGWAIEIVDLLRYRRSAVATFLRLTVQAMKDVSGRASDEPGSPVFDEERFRAFIAEDLERVWRLGFELGGYLSEHRVRALHGELLSHGQKGHQDRSAGAAAVNAAKRKVRDARRAEIRRRAPALLAGTDFPDGYKSWSVKALALAIWNSWHDADAPKLSTIEADVTAIGVAVLKAEL